MSRLLVSLCSKSLLALVLGLFSLGLSANGELSGSWYDPDRNGEGFHIEIWDEGQALIIWFTYPGGSDPAEAEQAWVLGQGTYSDNTIIIEDALKFGGPVFGPDYDKGDLQDRIWGDLTFTFQDNSSGKVVYDGADGSGEIDLTHLSSIAEDTGASTLPVGFSGSWYDPDTNGQGWFIEVLSDQTAIAYWFTYDENGNQAWNLGVGFIDGNKIVMRDAVRGVGTRFGEGFVKDNVEFPPYVEQVLEFHDCQSGTARYRTKEDLVGGTQPMVRLTGIQGKPCQVLTIEASEGGYITTEGDQPDCLEGRSCLVNLNSNAVSQTITAVPRQGHEFKGWVQSGGDFCSENDATCVPDTSTVEGDATLAPVFEPEGTIFYPPAGQITVCELPSLGVYEVDCSIKDFEEYGYGPLSDYVVTDPDTLFVDVEARRKDLDTLSTAAKNRWCANDPLNWPNFFEALGIDASSYTAGPPEDIYDDQTLERTFRTLQHARLYYDYYDNPDAAALVVRTLKAYAQAETWLDIHPQADENRFYNLGLAMTVYLMAWQSVRDDPRVSAEDRMIIDDYLGKLARFLTRVAGREEKVYRPEGLVYYMDLTSDVTNHQWPRDRSVMMYGILTGNDAMFQVGIKRFFAILDGIIRPDGSHTYESQRGGSAMGYSLGATSDVIRFAELAAHQGYDLYSVEVNGVSLTDIVAFHVAVMEDESLIHPYASDNTLFCDPPVCGNWDDQDSEETGYPLYQGWPGFELFRARFPDTPLLERFRAMYSDDYHASWQEGPNFQACEFRDITTLELE